MTSKTAHNISDHTAWPNFFIVGVASSGTSSLAAWLNDHPQVFFPKIKEPRYFAHDLVDSTVRSVVRTEREYLALFSKGAVCPARGDASTSYFTHWDQVSQRISSRVPDARIIVLLRDPVERAYSNYLMHVRVGNERLPFFEALQSSPHSRRYLQTYTDAVKMYRETFGSSRVLILLFEDLKRDPHKVLSSVGEFLGVDGSVVKSIDTSAKNTGGIPRNRIAQSVLSIRSALPITAARLPKPVREFGRRLLIGQKPTVDPRAVDFMKPLFADDLDRLESLLDVSLPQLRCSL